MKPTANFRLPPLLKSRYDSLLPQPASTPELKTFFYQRELLEYMKEVSEKKATAKSRNIQSRQIGARLNDNAIRSTLPP